jgi:hypothetical protein
MGAVPGGGSRVRNHRRGRARRRHGHQISSEEAIMSIGSIVGWVIVVLVVLWIIHNPAQAAADIHGIFAFGSDVSR